MLQCERDRRPTHVVVLALVHSKIQLSQELECRHGGSTWGSKERCAAHAWLVYCVEGVGLLLLLAPNCDAHACECQSQSARSKMRVTWHTRRQTELPPGARCLCCDACARSTKDGHDRPRRSMWCSYGWNRRCCRASASVMFEQQLELWSDACRQAQAHAQHASPVHFKWRALFSRFLVDITEEY